MKKIGCFLMLAGMVLVVACDSNKNGYVLTGTVPGDIGNGEVVYMTDYNDGFIVDSAVVSGRKFVFQGKADSAMARSLTIQYYQADVILDRGTMTVDMSDPYSARGNLLTNKLNEFYKNCGDAIMQARNKIAEISEALTGDERSQMEDIIFDELFAKIDEIPIRYLKEHPNDALGAMIFYIWMQNQMSPSAEIFSKASEHVGEYVLNFGPVKQMVENIERLNNTAVGMPFVDFTIEYGNRDGSTASLSDYVGKGKYVLVDFWASWCKPCRDEAPVIAEVYKKYKGNRFEVLGVAVMDKRMDTLNAIDDDGYLWPQIMDAQAIPLELYGIQGIPHIILFGPDGTILARELRGDNLKKAVAEVMK